MALELLKRLQNKDGYVNLNLRNDILIRDYPQERILKQNISNIDSYRLSKQYFNKFKDVSKVNNIYRELFFEVCDVVDATIKEEAKQQLTSKFYTNELEKQADSLKNRSFEEIEKESGILQAKKTTTYQDLGLNVNGVNPKLRPPIKDFAIQCERIKTNENQSRAEFRESIQYFVTTNEEKQQQQKIEYEILNFKIKQSGGSNQLNDLINQTINDYELSNIKDFFNVKSSNQNNSFLINVYDNENIPFNINSLLSIIPLEITAIDNLYRWDNEIEDEKRSDQEKIPQESINYLLYFTASVSCLLDAELMDRIKIVHDIAEKLLLYSIYAGLTQTAVDLNDIITKTEIWLNAAPFVIKSWQIWHKMIYEQYQNYSNENSESDEKKEELTVHQNELYYIEIFALLGLNISIQTEMLTIRKFLDGKVAYYHNLIQTLTDDISSQTDPLQTSSMREYLVEQNIANYNALLKTVSASRVYDESLNWYGEICINNYDFIGAEMFLRLLCYSNEPIDSWIMGRPRNLPLNTDMSTEFDEIPNELNVTSLSENSRLFIKLKRRLNRQSQFENPTVNKLINQTQRIVSSSRPLTRFNQYVLWYGSSQFGFLRVLHESFYLYSIMAKPDSPMKRNLLMKFLRPLYDESNLKTIEPRKINDLFLTLNEQNFIYDGNFESYFETFLPGSIAEWRFILDDLNKISQLQKSYIGDSFFSDYVEIFLDQLKGLKTDWKHINWQERLVDGYSTVVLPFIDNKDESKATFQNVYNKLKDESKRLNTTTSHSTVKISAAAKKFINEMQPKLIKLLNHVAELQMLSGNVNASVQWFENKYKPQMFFDKAYDINEGTAYFDLIDEINKSMKLINKVQLIVKRLVHAGFHLLLYYNDQNIDLTEKEQCFRALYELDLILNVYHSCIWQTNRSLIVLYSSNITLDTALRHTQDLKFCTIYLMNTFYYNITGNLHDIINFNRLRTRKKSSKITNDLNEIINKSNLPLAKIFVTERQTKPPWVKSIDLSSDNDEKHKQLKIIYDRSQEAIKLNDSIIKTENSDAPNLIHQLEVTRQTYNYALNYYKRHPWHCVQQYMLRKFANALDKLRFAESEIHSAELDLIVFDYDIDYIEQSKWNQENEIKDGEERNNKIITKDLKFWKKERSAHLKRKTDNEYIIKDYPNFLYNLSRSLNALDIELCIECDKLKHVNRYTPEFINQMNETTIEDLIEQLKEDTLNLIEINKQISDLFDVLKTKSESINSLKTGEQTDIDLTQVQDDRLIDNTIAEEILTNIRNTLEIKETENSQKERKRLFKKINTHPELDGVGSDTEDDDAYEEPLAEDLSDQELEENERKNKAREDIEYERSDSDKEIKSLYFQFASNITKFIGTRIINNEYKFTRPLTSDQNGLSEDEIKRIKLDIDNNVVERIVLDWTGSIDIRLKDTQEMENNIEFESDDEFEDDNLKPFNKIIEDRLRVLKLKKNETRDTVIKKQPETTFKNVKTEIPTLISVDDIKNEQISRFKVKEENSNQINENKEEIENTDESEYNEDTENSRIEDYISPFTNKLENFNELSDTQKTVILNEFSEKISSYTDKTAENLYYLYRNYKTQLENYINVDNKSRNTTQIVISVQQTIPEPTKKRKSTTKQVPKTIKSNALSYMPNTSSNQVGKPKAPPALRNLVDSWFNDTNPKDTKKPKTGSFFTSGFIEKFNRLLI